ncbi:hypothetical protein L3Y34_001425 [Caenorhabditis briggsae]|uniref:Uncharacterized protein n=1 Tax=Caenorhabditis briggsae TaxID=6238 RepID=A0AAE9IPS7_CAEBR|nr:hypothetical protein L3Y34_001425 [Caenorhabditis briggsae]
MLAFCCSPLKTHFLPAKSIPAGAIATRKMTMLDPDDLSPGEIVFSADDSAGERSFLAEFFGKKQSFALGSNLTGLIILCIVLTAVVVIFFGCYLMMRFMHKALARDDSKDMLRSNNPYNNVVMHSKRVYEIQAEEGCFNGPPDPLDPSEIDDEHLGDSQNTSVYIEDEEPQKVRKPESGDLRAPRNTEQFDDDPRAMLRKKQKVHKDSVCAFMFKPHIEPKMV